MSKTRKMNFNVDADLDDRFRNKIAETLGFKRGNLIKALEQAMELWINQPTK